MPIGADCVIMVEDIEDVNENTVRLTKNDTAINICYKSEDVKVGELVLKKGTIIRPQDIAMFASVGYSSPLVYKKPKVAVISTGNELVELGEVLPPSKIRNSNNIVKELRAEVPIDEKLIVLLQQPFPLVSNPWKMIAESVNRTESNLIEDINGLKRSGALKRISAVLRHRNAGFTANGMACFKVPVERIDEAGQTISEFSEVSHCYQRPVYPDWQYNLFAMTHARSTEQCESIISRIAKQINSDEYFTLYSIKEFKKERVKYFMEDSNVN